MAKKTAKPVIRIENIVATVTLHQELDLNYISREIPGVSYQPEEFPGLILRLQNPRLTALIFGSGKMVVTGAKSVNQLIRGFRRILRMLARHGIVIRQKPSVHIQNIVASANLGVEVDLEKAAELLENSMYEPEQFPGLIYRMTDPNVVLLIFSSGKMVITGAKSEENVKKAVEKIYKTLQELGCVRTPPSDYATF